MNDVSASGAESTTSPQSVLRRLTAGPSLAGALLDFSLLASIVALFVTRETVVAFHLVFLLITIQAFRVPLISLLVRAVPAGISVLVRLLVALAADDVPVDEVLELPLLSAVVTIVYMTSSRRQRLTREVEDQRSTIQEIHAAGQRELKDLLLLTQRLQLNGRLNAAVAHDVNNVLSSIQLTAETLSEDMDQEGLASVEGELVDYVVQAGEITRELLDTARSANSVKAQPPADLAGAMEAVEPHLRRLCGRSNQLTVTHTGPTALLQMPRLRLEQILANLVLNAIDASAAGDAYIAVKSIVERDAHGEAWAVILVSDRGHGMDESTRAKIFQPFFTSRSSHGGTGLGLFAARELLNDAGGSISVTTIQGKGSTFRIRIPVLELERRPLARSESLPSSARHVALRVLVADDDNVIRRLLAEGLRGAGHEVTTAVDGSAAHHLLLSSPGEYDILVVDVMMPGLSGVDLARLLAVDNPDLPIVFMSGFERLRPDEWDPAQSVRFLQKPVQMADLLTTLQILSSSDI